MPLRLYKARKSVKHSLRFTLAVAAAGVLLCAGLFGVWLWQRGASAESALQEAVSAAEFAAAQGDLPGALTGLDGALTRYRSVRSDSSDPSDSSVPTAPAEALRMQLRERQTSAAQARLAKQSGLVAEGDARLKDLKYAEALAVYQQAAALGESAEITAKIGTAETWKAEAEAKIAAAESSRRAAAQRQQETSAAEVTREREYAAALAAARRFLGEGEDGFDPAREQSAKARELARSQEEIASATAVQDAVAAAQARRRPWAAAVDFTLDPSVKLDLTGSAVAVKLEQALGGSYRLVTRSQVAKALGELRFQASDLADRTKAQALGKQIGAEYLITGTVLQLGREATVAAQIFKVETGAIRQTADNTAFSADEMDSAFFAEIAQVLSLTMEEKAAYLAAKPKVARAPSAAPTAGKAWTVAELGLEFVYVAPGSFQMGSKNGGSEEKPVHAVRISRGFWLGKYEVTQAEYEAVVGTNPSSFKGARNPVETVSWNDASAFCAKLTERERAAGRLPAGYEYRLPTEAEWEYAARGGAASKGYTYAGSNNVDEVAWYDKNSGNATHPVGKLKANEVGLYDMSGNVWEWCLDWYDGEYYGRSPNVDPANTQAASNRVDRGGGWSNVARCVRSAYRDWLGPGGTDYILGFRACLAPQSVGQ